MNKYSYFRSTPNFSLVGFAIGLAVSLVACAVPAGGDSAAGARAQADQLVVASSPIIVKFRTGVDPTNAQFLRKMSEGLGVSLVYLHPLSSDAHLLQVRGYKDVAHLLQLVAQLNRRTEVVYAEPDARMRHQ